MKSLAATQYPIHELIQSRWSPQAFSEQIIETEMLNSILEAARWAPSSFNEQPWCFIVATKQNPPEFDHLLSCLVEANQAWAKHASVLMISVAKLYFDRNGKDNRHAFHDVGAAASNLALQATALGLFAHQMAGFDREKTRETFSIPEGYEPVAVIALGYLGEPQTLPEKLRDAELAPRTRRALETFTITGKWGQPYSSQL
ncbi:MAG: nitroreductase family protein [Chroococcidiopsidaceae cyanobacterium CP_BM_ER_R8_30]|nr:nitroreductase family protein [Chroococcidiopsidaceae cyanobacterium CP_BM_ER_R8_30]